MLKTTNVEKLDMMLNSVEMVKALKNIKNFLVEMKESL
jgi:glutaredoxin-related protein